MATKQYKPPLSETPISDSYNRGKYRDFDRGRRSAADKPYEHGPVKVLYTTNPDQVIDPPTFLGMRAGQLRREAPKCEVIVKRKLKELLRQGISFQHSVSMHGYIADFYCVAKKLVVELDGPHHRDQRAYDRRRDMVLRKHGIRTIRFPSSWAYTHLDWIIADISKAVGL